MGKVNIKPRAIMYPAPAVVVSCYDGEGNVDACTLAFSCMCSHYPPCLMIAINSSAKRKTLRSILEAGEFVLGFPSVSQIDETDFLGMFSGYDMDKVSRVSFSTDDAEFVDAPVICEFPVSVECRVINVLEGVGSHTQITGEIVNIVADESVLDDEGRISLKLLDPIVYDDVLYDYFRVGDKCSDAFKPGLRFK